MKIRYDYVSNSSSSSFMLVGHAYENDELMNAWIKLHPEDKDAVEDGDIDTWEVVDKLANELDLSFNRGIYEYSDMWVLGLNFNEMKDDETKTQFIKRIKESLDKAFNHTNVEAIVDGGYEG